MDESAAMALALALDVSRIDWHREVGACVAEELNKRVTLPHFFSSCSKIRPLFKRGPCLRDIMARDDYTYGESEPNAHV